MCARSNWYYRSKTTPEPPEEICEQNLTPDTAWVKTIVAALPHEIIQNRKLLRETMAAAGFTALKSEWWHYDSNGWEDFPVLDVNVWGEPLFPDGMEGIKKPAVVQ